MSFTRNAREQAEAARTFYSGSEILRNKLGIKDARILEQAERLITQRQAEKPFPAKAAEMTYNGFKSIHAHLFGELYSWAGQERKYTTGRGPAPFAPPEQISPWMEKRFQKLKQEKFLKGLTKDQFAKRAAEHVNEINAAHPFVDGNGRTQRAWLRLVADKAGYELKLSSKDAKSWNAASKAGFEKVDHKPMAGLIKANLTQRSKSKTQHKETLSRKAGQASKALNQSRTTHKSHDRGR